MSALLPIWSLTQREIVRFFRQRSRVMGAFAQPIIFWVLFGVGHYYRLLLMLFLVGLRLCDLGFILG